MYLIFVKNLPILGKIDLRGWKFQWK